MVQQNKKHQVGAKRDVSSQVLLYVNRYDEIVLSNERDVAALFFPLVSVTADLTTVLLVTRGGATLRKKLLRQTHLQLAYNMGRKQ